MSLLHSTSPEEYAVHASPEVQNALRRSVEAVQNEPYVLVVGNLFAHKFLRETLSLISEKYPNRAVTALGVDGTDTDKVKYLQGGALSDAEVNRLYAEAEAVLFPSHYEGFGLPIMRALASKTPVVVRNIPVFHEIREKSPLAQNIHIFSTTIEMIEAACSGKLTWMGARSEAPPELTWNNSAESIVALMQLKLTEISQSVIERKVSLTEKPHADVAFREYAASLMSHLTLEDNEVWRRLRNALQKVLHEEERQKMEIELIGSSPFFDRSYYERCNPDVVRAGMDYATRPSRMEREEEVRGVFRCCLVLGTTPRCLCG